MSSKEGATRLSLAKNSASTFKTDVGIPRDRLLLSSRCGYVRRLRFKNTDPERWSNDLSISLKALKFFIGSRKVTSNKLAKLLSLRA